MAQLIRLGIQYAYRHHTPLKRVCTAHTNRIVGKDNFSIWQEQQALTMAGLRWMAVEMKLAKYNEIICDKGLLFDVIQFRIERVPGKKGRTKDTERNRR